MAAAEWIVFDAYGTLFDLETSLRGGARARALPAGFALQWRAKQLEYTWMAQAMGDYRDFWTLTRAALEWTISALGASGAPREELMDTYLRLEPYPEAGEALRTLAGSGARLAVLSNGTAAMLDAALGAARLKPLLDMVISVDEIGVYKPDPRVYRHAARRLGAPGAQIRFVSANPWDAAGAARCGFRVVWVNRHGAPPEYGLAAASLEVADLHGVRDSDPTGR
jgi:2-haloacid dehalogenase